MPRKKIVIRINYKQSGSNKVAVPKDEINDDSEWDVKRILVAFIVLLSIAAGLVYFLSSDAKTVRNLQGAEVISQKPGKLESPGEIEQLPRSDPIDQEQKHVPSDGNTRNRQEPKKPVSRQRTPIPLQNVAGEGKKPIGNLNVIRFRFTSGIKRKEPVDILAPPFFALRDKAYSIYFFTELKRLKGHTVTHVWKHNGQVKLNKEFEVRGNRWRIYTSKLLNMTMLGQWDVSVVDSNGQILTQKGFELKPPLER